MAMNRRNFLKLSGVGAAGLALGASGLRPSRTVAQDQFDWRAYEGVPVRFIGAGGGNEAWIEQMSAQFVEETGIDFIFEDYQQEQGRQKYRTELQAGLGTVSSWMTSMVNEGPQFVANGWYEPLDDWVNSQYTAPDFDFADFLPGVINGLKYDGVLYALPLNVDFHVLYYRKDLFEEAGLTPPATLEEMEEAARILHDPPNIYGIALRGSKGHAVAMFPSALHNFGADYLDENGNPNLTSPEAIAAFEWWGRMAREYGPPGGATMDFSTSTALLNSGRVAMIADSATFVHEALNPELSAVTDLIGFAKWPAGPERDTPTIFVNGLPMSSTSKNKEATWYFQQWMTSKNSSVLSYLAALGQTRASVIEDERTKGALPEDFVEAANFSMVNGDTNWVPRVLRIPEARDVIGNIIVVAIEGGDVKAAAARANDELIPLLEEAR